MNIIFKPEIKSLGEFQPNYIFHSNQIKNELMFFGCNIEFIRAREAQAPITNALIDEVLKQMAFEYYGKIGLPTDYIVVDTRVTMLMPGQYPSIPGWHCDDVPRTQGQPDFSKPLNCQHYMCLVSANRDGIIKCPSSTEFITSTHEFEINPLKVWQSLHEQAELVEKKTRFVKEREIVKFNQLAIHRASPAVSGGWRLFFRLSLTDRPPTNEVRNQVQIYVDPNQAGW